MSNRRFKEEVESRSQLIVALVEKAFALLLPPSHVVSKELFLFPDGACIGFIPRNMGASLSTVYVTYEAIPRACTAGDEAISQECVCAHAVSYVDGEWKVDQTFGELGTLRVPIRCNELAAAVRQLTVETLITPVFAQFSWATCSHDKHKRELFVNGEKRSCVWKVGSQWGTLLGTIENSLLEAKLKAESSVKMAMLSTFGEQLASL